MEKNQKLVTDERVQLNNGNEVEDEKYTFVQERVVSRRRRWLKLLMKLLTNIVVPVCACMLVIHFYVMSREKGEQDKTDEDVTTSYSGIQIDAGGEDTSVDENEEPSDNNPQESLEDMIKKMTVVVSVVRRETILPQEEETGDKTDTGSENGDDIESESEADKETESEGEKTQDEDTSGLDVDNGETIKIIESTNKYTGVIVADEGPIYILIPAASIENYDEMYTHIGTESMVPTTVYNIDEATGLALLKIEASRITPDMRACMKVVSFEGGKRQEEGQEIIYCGSVVGNSPMFFRGHISNSGNVINCLDINYNLIITDIMYSNANDGFIFNDRGNLVAISGMDYGDLQLPEMIAGAKAIDLGYIINNMLNDKNNIYFGIYAQNVSSEIEEMAGYDMPKGIYVKNVVIDSPAYNAGILAGDIITVVGNKHSVTMIGFRKEIESRSKGDTVQVKVKRKIGSVYNTYNLLVYLETVN